jgi:Protein of unknown function (DUF1360)
MDLIGPSLRIVLAVLATWRVTHLLASEDGPGDLIFHLRAKLGSSFAGKLMDCFYCLSLWVAAPVAMFVTLHFTDWVLAWLALSGTACLLERVTQERTSVQNFSAEGDGHAMLRPEEREPEDRSAGGSER